MSAATEKQEKTSRLFFQRYLDANGSWTQFQQDEVERLAFDKVSGIYPNAPRKWKENFYKQLTALASFMSTWGIPQSGWVWSRGDGMMGFLNNIAVQKCGVSTLDNWNPMDIVGVKRSAEMTIRNACNAMIVTPTTDAQKIANKDILNEIMIENIDEKKLMPISLKFIDLNERPGYELSPELQTQRIKEASRHHFNVRDVTCDLKWDTTNNQWKDNQEISWRMVDDGAGGRRGISIKIQGRTFGARARRENPQHEGTPDGAGAKLGKAAITELRAFVTGLGLTAPQTPSQHPQIPAAGDTWTDPMKNYWILLYNSLASASIDGAPINFKSPGVYGESMTPTKTGFAAALDAACKADEDDLYVISDPKVPVGNRLCAKLWGLEWLDLYRQIDNKGKWDAFMHIMYHSCKKELPGMGPFIKIAGR